MDYQKIYNSIIENAQKQSRKKYCGVYYESHHIIPLCLGGTGKYSQWKYHNNLILLTGKEHYICHRLLCLIHPNNSKLVHALWRMLCKGVDTQKRYIPNGKIYQHLKESYSKSDHLTSTEARERHRQYLLKHNPMDTPEARKKRAASLVLYFAENEGSMKGIKHTEDALTKMRQPKKIITCPICNKKGGAGNMKRFHFDNCKQNKLYEKKHNTSSCY
jgi:hypothetical protein